ncbi:putative NBD/HSP70 family sugar kinase [Arthrobacter oryzae]|nr:putative NBD/HSP70 family sugar kinase [Arthrobacter oryzae]
MEFWEQNDGRGLVVDVGGSGTRFAAVEKGVVGPIRRSTFSSLHELALGLRHLCNDPAAIAISVPGFVDNSRGVVRMSRVAPWLQGDLAAQMRHHFPLAKVSVFNDGDAHALAMHRLQNLQLGAVAVAIGTSLAIGVLDRQGALLHPASGENWDLGDLRLRTSATNDAAWWALGSEGVAELRARHEDIPSRFGYRLGGFIVQLCTIFQPSTIGLSGGHISALWPHLKDSLFEEMQRIPAHLPCPAVRRVHTEEAALEGLAVAIGG